MNQPVPVRPSLDALLLDPSLFTPAYDAGLTEGLVAAGIRPLWLTRPLRPREEAEIPEALRETAFYRRVETIPAARAKLRGLAKGASHLADLMALVRRVRRVRPDIVHIQWAVLPFFDTLAIRLLGRICPVVMTVHDTVPFNGQKISLLQNAGFDLPVKAATEVIVHTQAARETLLRRGVDPARVHVVAHGPLALKEAPSEAALARPRDPRFTFVLFGQIKPYKGVDLLVEALGRIACDVRARGRVVVAGAAMMDMAPVLARAEELGLGDAVEFRLGRLGNQDMADLFHEADAFVFPYRQIDASGVYFLLKPLGKWMVASRVGIFAEDLREGADGVLVPAGDVEALTAALEQAFEHRPSAAEALPGGSWAEIGEQTRAVYEKALREHKKA